MKESCLLKLFRPALAMLVYIFVLKDFAVIISRILWNRKFLSISSVIIF